MFNPINVNTNQMNNLAYDTPSGQKLENKGATELPRRVIEKKDNLSSAREEVPREEVEKTLEKLNRLLGLIDKRMEFKIHEKTNRVLVKIVDQANGEIINEIPAEKTLDLLSAIQDAVGLLFDENV